MGCRLLSVFVFVTSCLAPELTQAADVKPIRESVREYYYDISGRSGRDLLKEMEEKGPESSFGQKRYFARTDTHFDWSYEFERSNGNCAIRSISMTLLIEYRMPRWVNYEQGNKRLRARWDQFIDALWVHEYGHGEIGKRQASELQKLIATTGPSETCDELSKKVASVSKEFLRSGNPHREYDRETQHGKTQGAYFEVR